MGVDRNTCLSFLMCKTEMTSLTVMGRDELGISTKRLKHNVGLGTPSPAHLPWPRGPCRPGGGGSRSWSQRAGPGARPATLIWEESTRHSDPRPADSGNSPAQVKGGPGAAGLWSLLLPQKGPFPPYGLVTQNRFWDPILLLIPIGEGEPARLGFLPPAVMRTQLRSEVSPRRRVNEPARAIGSGRYTGLAAPPPDSQEGKAVSGTG